MRKKRALTDRQHVSHHGLTMQLSTGTVYGEKYFTIEPSYEPSRWEYSSLWHDMVEWCVDNFGNIAHDVTKPTRPAEPDQRWYVASAKFWFRNEHDYLLFLLRWA